MESTILVLGAGASIPYKFPSTEVLRQSIIREALSIRSDQELEAFQTSISELNRFHEAFKKSVIYIDQFLENLPQFLRIGKILLARVLLKYEVPKTIFEIDIEKDWYRYLIDTIISPGGRIKLHPLTILTFNYDRSLEYYLYTTLTSRFNFSLQECREQLKQIKIYHLYGSLGLLNWQIDDESESDRIIEYGGNLTPEIILEASQSLKVIYERDDNHVWEKLPELYKITQRIFFLGFGFNTINLERLQLKEFDKMRFCCGTAKNIGKVEKETIRSMSRGRIMPENLIDTEIINLFRNHFGLG